jgi:midasin
MKHSDADLVDLICTLLEHGDRAKQILDSIRDLPHLSAGICSKKEIEFVATIEDLLDELRRNIQGGIVKYPQSGNVLQKLLPWTDMTTIEIKMAVNGFNQPDIHELDHDICDCLETTFETIQKVSRVSDRLPDSTDISGWLAKTGRRQAEMMSVLRIADVAEKLAKIEMNLAHILPDDLAAGISLVVIALPILEQYLLACQYIIGQGLALHHETARMTVVLARAMTTIAKEGFCSPQEASKVEEQSGPVESGTGLGDGTGAEDISKDVGDNEDLSELAQTENEKPDGQELEALKDAVNMDKDDLKGDDGGAEETVGEEDESSQSGEEGSDLDEETGSLDNLDPSAVDERMWEGLDAQKDKELESEKAKGEKLNEQTAKQEKQAKGEDEKQDEAHDDDIEDSGSGSEDEGEGVGRDDIDQADSNMQQEKPLDLPDEMQLNGEENGAQDDVDDDGMADLSDVEDVADPKEPKEAEFDDAEEEDKKPVDEGTEDHEHSEVSEHEEESGKGDHDEIMEDQPEPEVADEDHDHDTRNDDMTYDIDEDQAGEMGEGGAFDAENAAADISREKAATSKSDLTKDLLEDVDSEKDNEKGNDETDGVTRGGRSEADVANPQAEALKKLGDMLEKWHQRREIHQATQNDVEQADDIDMADADFEHLQNEQDEGDAQALGAASKEQAQALEQSKAVEDDETHGDTEQPPADVVEDQSIQESMVERFGQLQTTHSELQQDSGPGAIMPDRRHEPDHADGQQEREVPLDDENLDDIVNDQLANGAQEPLMSQVEASQMWSHYSTKVQHISLILTEQLRLILAPTLATKLRGDFRTGKRLNIKRIIPYIASGYKRDKIWMRRSVPSKRNYQIMLALDDSKSMMEGGAGALAFETLAMLCKSLSMLEVGDLCVVGFGNEEHIRVAHPFGQPFGNEAGVKIFQNFAFNQTATDVKKMVKESIGLFQDARAKSTGSQSELWQLQLIISDGICEDHETVSRLVRQAKEEKILIVFVIVDGSGESILDLKQASFEADETGEMKLSMRRYLDRFPFPYYLVVRDVRDLPAVLATALKGWFAQVVDASA